MIAPVTTMNPMPIHVDTHAAWRARSGFPAPRFWPTIVAAAPPSANAGIRMIMWKRRPTPYAATAAVPQPATIHIITALIRLRENICPDPGRPIRRMRHSSCGSGFQWWGRMCRRALPLSMMCTARPAATACDSTVATAAPSTFIRGRGPMPKMNRGARMILRTFDTAMTHIGVIVSPAPCSAAFAMNRMNTVNPPSREIFRYALPSGMISGAAPSM